MDILQNKNTFCTTGISKSFNIGRFLYVGNLPITKLMLDFKELIIVITYC